MSDNFPSIGEPVLDPSEKFPEDGVNKYDLLLADGGEVFEDEHPVYWGELPASAYDRRNIIFDVSHYSPSSVPPADGTYGAAVKPTDTGNPDWDAVWGGYYGVTNGLSLAEYTAPNGSVTTANNRVTLEHSEDIYSCNFQASATASEDNRADIELHLIDSEDKVVYAIKTVQRSPGVDPAQVEMYTSQDALSWTLRPAQGGFYRVLVDWDYNESTRELVFTPTSAISVAPFTEEVLAFDTVVEVVVVSSYCLHYWPAATSAYAPLLLSRKQVVSKHKPDMTSPDPSCPYRIVADLT